MKKLNFDIPFSSFASTTFINCFSSVYLYLEGILQDEKDITYCNQWENGNCNGCGNCESKPQAIQERFFFLFDTMCGRSSLRCHFDGSPTEIEKMINDKNFYDGGASDNIDFLFGFAGYDYHTLKDASLFIDAISDSISKDKPVIIKLKDGNVPFSIITGVDDETFICPSFKGAQKSLGHVPSCNEIDVVYIIGDKISPRYTLIDGLKRIRTVMEYNNSEHLWDEYIERLGKYGANGLDSVDIAGKKARLHRVSETMWHTFNCHNFAEVFRLFTGEKSSTYDMVCDVSKLKNPLFKENIQEIGFSLYGYTHDLAFALIALEECVDWNTHAAGFLGEMIELTLSQIKKNDENVLQNIQKLITILEA